jgi:hypothetical protein
MREKYYSLDTDKLPALSHTTLQAELIAQTFDGQRKIYRLTQQTLSLAIVHKDNRLKMSYFLGSNRYETTVWGSRDLLSSSKCLAVAHQSSLITHDRRFLAVWQEIVVKFYLPPQPCRNSKIASKSAKSVFDFLRLAGELVENFGNVINGMLPLMEMVCYRFVQPK